MTTRLSDRYDVFCGRSFNDVTSCIPKQYDVYRIEESCNHGFVVIVIMDEVSATLAINSTTIQYYAHVYDELKNELLSMGVLIEKTITMVELEYLLGTEREYDQ